jgi:uncharacterized protein (DUF1697 family)
MRWVALLRGVNVGGARKVPMAQLRELLSGLGYDGVRTYVQSGNAVFDADESSAAAVRRQVERAIEDAVGFDVLVTLRSREQLAEVVAANPFPQAAPEPKTLHVLFLSEPIGDERLAFLDADAFAPEQVALRGSELYLWLPDGLGRSKLAAAITERKLGVAATARNWRTVETLLAWASELD